MHLDLDVVASFVVLTEERHFGRAAARLHVSSPALTKRVQRLERDLGVLLVERGPDGVVLTGAGRRFAAAAVPLLRQAQQAQEAARRQPAAYVVRIGVPAGTGNFLAGLGLASTVRAIRRRWPEASFTFREVTFPALAGCVPDGDVDVLWDCCPVEHHDVEAVPLAVTSPVMGVVGVTHPLAEAGSITAEEFCEQPILFNPALPPAWMEPFWLAGVRPRAEARLVESTATDQVQVLRAPTSGTTVVVAPAVVRPTLGPRVRAVELRGAAPVSFHASRRRTDRREAVLALVEAFRSLPAQSLGERSSAGS